MDLVTHVKSMYQRKKRLVAPLIGMPGMKMLNSTIKLGQQNYRIHHQALDAINERFNPDIIFPLMDLSVEANAIGRYTIFPIDDTATVPHLAFHLDHVGSLPPIDISADSRAIGYAKTLELLHQNASMKNWKGAYVTGPYTLAALIVGAETAAESIILDPGNMHTLLRYSQQVINDYSRLLIRSGAQIICILEPSASMLGPTHFMEFSGNYVKNIVSTCSELGAASVYHICGNTMHLIENMVASGVNALSIDSPSSGVDLLKILNTVPENVLIIGNIDPVGNILTGSASDVIRDVTELLESTDAFPNFILSTGCDLPKNTPLPNIDAFINTGREYKIST